MPRAASRDRSVPAGREGAVVPDALRSRIRVGDRGCWLWQGTLDKDGYAQLSVKNRTVRLHRWLYIRTRGTIGCLELDHLCRNKNCVNPGHLEPVTHAENSRRHHRLQTHCKRGHPLSGSNLLVRKKKNGNSRECVACVGIRRRRRYQQLGL